MKEEVKNGLEYAANKRSNLKSWKYASNMVSTTEKQKKYLKILEEHRDFLLQEEAPLEQKALESVQNTLSFLFSTPEKDEETIEEYSECEKDEKESDINCNNQDIELTSNTNLNAESYYSVLMALYDMFYGSVERIKEPLEKDDKHELDKAYKCIFMEMMPIVSELQSYKLSNSE